MSGWQCDQIWRNFATLAKIKKSWSLFGIWENFELALTVVVNKTHGPSPQTTAVWQLEVTRPKARFKPTSTKKSRVDGGVISRQHILVSCLNCTPMVICSLLAIIIFQSHCSFLRLRMRVRKRIKRLATKPINLTSVRWRTKKSKVNLKDCKKWTDPKRKAERGLGNLSLVQFKPGADPLNILQRRCKAMQFFKYSIWLKTLSSQSECLKIRE